MLSIIRSASSMTWRPGWVCEGESSLAQPRPLPSPAHPTYQETEVLEAEAWGLVDVVHQATRGSHHNVSQAAEAVNSTK